MTSLFSFILLDIPPEPQVSLFNAFTLSVAAIGLLIIYFIDKLLLKNKTKTARVIWWIGSLFFLAMIIVRFALRYIYE